MGSEAMGILHVSLGVLLALGLAAWLVYWYVQDITQKRHTVLRNYPIVGAASILAKVTRDRIMMEFARAHPGYGWETNMGYGTREHYDALTRLGVTAHHRRSFAPVRAVLASEWWIRWRGPWRARRRRDSDRASTCPINVQRAGP